MSEKLNIKEIRTESGGFQIGDAISVGGLCDEITRLRKDLEVRHDAIESRRYFRDAVLWTCEDEEDEWRNAGTSIEKREAGIAACQGISRRLLAIGATPATNLLSRVRRLQRALESLRSEKLDEAGDRWGIKCITDHNAIIDEVLDATKEVPRAD
jgi:hypothetical protein